jgi:hypothetical protein
MNFDKKLQENFPDFLQINNIMNVYDTFYRSGTPQELNSQTEPNQTFRY